MDCVAFFSYLFIILLVLFSLCWTSIGIAGCFAVDIVDGVGPSIALTVIGAVILLICILGFVGLRRQSPRVLWVFIGLSITMLVVYIGLRAGFRASSSDFEADVKKVVDDIWKKEMVQEGSMDRIQKQYHCCGLTSAYDYTLIDRLPPKTCCDDLPCDDLPCDDPKTIEREGCEKEVIKFLIGNYNSQVRVENVTVFVLFLCIVITTWMAIRFRELKGRPNY